MEGVLRDPIPCSGSMLRPQSKQAESAVVGDGHRHPSLPHAHPLSSGREEMPLDRGD